MSNVLSTQRIKPFLWFDGKTEEAINLYVSTFPNSEILTMNRWGGGAPFPADQISSASFILDGLQFNAFDAGPMFKFTEALSLFVTCKDQIEVDYYWEKLTEGGQESQCGWLKDRFGLSWQIVPEYLSSRISSGDPKKTQQMMQALMPMRKIEIAILEAAYNK